MLEATRVWSRPTGRLRRPYGCSGVPTLSVREGEIVAIVGPSGVGKSTLLHILGALDRPDEGSVFVDSLDVFSLGDSRLAGLRNAHFGFVFQFHHLLPELTALENVMMPCLIAGLDARESTERARRMLVDEVGAGRQAGAQAAGAVGRRAAAGGGGAGRW